MSATKFFRRTLATLIVVATVFFASTVEAATQTYEGVGVFTITAGETQNFAKKQAKLAAERDALEQIYLFIKSQSSAKNFEMFKDEIITIAAGCMNVLQTKFDVNKDDDFFVITATVIAEIDPDEIPKAVERERKKRLQ